MASISDALSFPKFEAPAAGAVSGSPNAILRLEGLAALALAVLGFRWLGGSWLLFAELFLVPDVSMLGYLSGRRLGAAAYNIAHSYIGPALLGSLGAALVSPMATQVALIWAAHIGFDRVLGYGLKYPTAFGDTHLGLAGNRGQRA
jgi:Domain of unknown function (DUF4260)